MKVRESNNASGSIGDATLPSTAIKAIRHATPRIKLPQTSGFRQPKLTDSMKPATKPPNPMVASIAPDQSMRPVPAMRLSGMCQSEMVITATASGRLMKNTHRQEAC